MIKIVGYARESTMDQAHNGFNMADQVRRITNYCQTEYGDQEYSLEIRREEGCSGKDLDRPEIDIIAVYCLDRLTRSLKDLNELLNNTEKVAFVYKAVVPGILVARMENVAA